MLKEAGIYKAGHRRRLLMKLFSADQTNFTSENLHSTMWCFC